MTDALEMWTVYDHPRDFPDLYVARLFRITGDGAMATHITIRAQTLDKLREALPPGLSCLERNPGDDSKIVEVWL